MNCNKNLKSVLLSLLLSLSFCTGMAAGEGDSLRVSLLTCAPGQQSFELFGHSGIRVRRPSDGTDIVFHYGVFSFNAPHFIYRFTKGETDYSIGVADFSDFVYSYTARHSGVTEQVLNLTAGEKEALLEALLVNYRPENRVYRYNFLADNCATRPLNMIERSVGGRIGYMVPEEKPVTFREMIHRCTAGHDWLTFGIDLALGAPLDTTISFRDEMFLPAVLMEAFGRATVVTGAGSVTDSGRLLVTDTYVYEPLAPRPESASGPLTGPLACGLYLLAVVAALSVWEWRKNTRLRWLDTVLFALYGITGCVLFFLVFVSEHPATSPNWSLVWANPLQLLIAVSVWVKYLKRVVNYYHFVNFAILLLFLLSWAFLPQRLNTAFIPYILVLMVRSFAAIGAYIRDRKKNVCRKGREQ
ncbi:MAG: DUF4105 domain-containing protein [Coprobacter sp.]|nr:DUF4105 domain-containing protein [Coprobacter sp.]